MKRKIGRRAFLSRASLGIAAAATGGSALAQMGGGGMGGGGMGGGGMGGGVVDPPVGSALADPPVAANASTTAGVVDVTIEARLAEIDLNGTRATLLTYDGSFIAPTIRARSGDEVRLHFRNGLPPTGDTNLLGHEKYVTNVHVHGWHVSPGDVNGYPADDVHLTLSPAQSQEYRYDLAMQRPGSIGLYHPHVHGSVAEQYWGGLVGALDVQDDAREGSGMASITALAGVDTHLVVLKDITIVGGAPAPYESLRDYMHGKEGQLVTVNGQVNPFLSMRPGEVKRLRIINASNARFYRLSLQGHALHVVGTDGGLLDRPYAVTEMLLSPGERLDVLVKASSSKGSYKLLALPYARMGNMASAQVTLMTVKVSGSRASGAIPAIVNGTAARLDETAMEPKRVRFVLSMGQGRGYVNGRTFVSPEDAYVHMSDVGTDELWEIVNDSGMDHPWHQHVNDGQVVAASGGDAAFAAYASFLTLAPAWKDTIIIPKGGSVTMRLPIRDHTGMTMCHCHILEHEDIGMMAMWHIMGEGMPM
ncbi:multicopper oxidase family protein [Anaeromyxobacter sp. Fw109-5]|uniref:multicopper oxidase family protein n=1 Tax=Anaeromyxobacter sp. (strain Fw109-5) TaxID=404589 RepID=UPI0000ED7DC7|nr:multicopper oxidase family protein [Anaeromyxobacter sp. Fw109-5]ABS25806.1 multicopper oxidase type 2 [Anaeromyxobacter sp. Fw109-5]